MTPSAEETLTLLREILDLPGASIRLYRVAGSLSGEAWQCAINWDTHQGINAGFNVGVRQDPIAALADVCRHTLEHKIGQPQKPADDGDFAFALSHSVSLNAHDDYSLDDLLG